MLTMEDCIGLSGLSGDEIDAIAEHEHLPAIVAVELGCCLVGTAAGQRRIAACIRDDIEHARAHGRVQHAADLDAVLRHFVDEHAPLAGTGNRNG